MRLSRWSPLLPALLALPACAGSEKPSRDAEPVLSGSLCEIGEGQTPASPTPDGSRVAYLGCTPEGPQVIVHDLTTGDETVLAPAEADSSVEWLLDTKSDARFVAFASSAAGLSVVADDGTGEPVRIGTGTVSSHRPIAQKQGNTTIFLPRLLVLEEEGDTKRISLHRPDDGYSVGSMLLEEPNLRSDLSALSASGRTLVLTLEQGGELEYRGQLTGEMTSFEMPFGPKTWVLAPVGLGDKHTYVLQGDELARIELSTGKTTVIVPADSGLLEGTAHILAREDRPGAQHVYYIQNGDPTRAERPEKVGEPLPKEPEVIVEANAVAQVLTPDTATLLYKSDGALYAVSAAGGDPRLLVEDTGDGNEIPVVFSSTPAAASAQASVVNEEELFAQKSELAFLAHGTLYRILLSDDTVQPISGPEPRSVAHIAYDGLGEALWYLSTDGALAHVGAGETDAQILAETVDRFWAVPESSSVLVARNGRLELLAPAQSSE